MTDKTVYAPSSAIGGAIAVIRISGSLSKSIARRILSANVTATPARLCHTRIIDGDEVIDEAMAVYFAAPATYTGEDMLELHCHGGAQTVQAVLACLSKTGARPAENGEFTKRAFLNGKMDLSRAEAVMDVINAAASRSLKAALLQLQGGVFTVVNEVSELLLDALAGIDAAIDYPDEAYEDAYEDVPQRIAEARSRLDALIASGRRGRVLREGLRLAIVGKPNVGKSSLLNALLGRERAIVTAEAGTTRDTIEELFSVRGFPIRLVDTAGIREGAATIEAIGIERARSELKNCDLALVVLDGSAALDENDRAVLELSKGLQRLVVQNKADLCSIKLDEATLLISAATGLGMADLEAAIASSIGADVTDETPITNERHLFALERARECLLHAAEALELDCIATDIRDGLHWIGTITGADVDSQVIDRIFENFCVGK
ncbi:MAG: tRNA uridine-5-carboxymethylaminomethyl(34) synthesis GTPase MnmE [Clostridia bacterium]|nr:tRNA uridine-5-carboxymethylaminomethyl(34) synthesis GTPase MnmE [Clostridia bacterium]